MNQFGNKTKEMITISQPFAAVIKKMKTDHGNTLVVINPDYYKTELNKFKDGENVTLCIHNKKPKRTEQQNRYYWGVYLPLIAKETGENNKDTLHELFKGEFLTEAIVEVLGKKVRIKKSTTDLTVFDFCQYIMNIEEMTGVPAPPTENYNLISLEEGIKKGAI